MDTVILTTSKRLMIHQYNTENLAGKRRGAFNDRQIEKRSDTELPFLL